MIEQRQKDGWVFVFLGANQDAMLAAGSMGMHAGTVMNTAANAAGTQAMYTSTSTLLNNVRGGAASASYTASDRDKQTKAGAVKNSP